MKKTIYFSGFHLIELLMTLAIISIFIAINLPNYLQYLVQEKRLEAETMLSKLAVAMEQYQFEQNSYQQATLAKLHFSDLVAKNNYQLMIKSATDFDYMLAAIPLGAQAENDRKCGILLLNSSSEKFITGFGRVEDCW